MQTSEDIIDKQENEAYRIERLTEKNLKDLETLHEVVYGKAPARQYYYKKYDTSYSGLCYVGFIAYDISVGPVAYYGVLPCYIRAGNQTVLAAQSADTMTHPQHRYKGMFMDLSNLTFQLCRELGIRLIFGFPNQNSYHGALKLGWKMTESLSSFLIPVRTIPFKALAKKNMFLHRLYIRYINGILNKIKLDEPGFVSSVLADGFAGVERSREYLDYKTYSSTNVVRFGKSKIWISCKDVLLIGDMENVDQNNFKELMRELVSLAKKFGLRQIQFHVSPGTSLHTLFSENYEASASFPALFQDFGSAVSPEKIKFSLADIDIF